MIPMSDKVIKTKMMGKIFFNPVLFGPTAIYQKDRGAALSGLSKGGYLTKVSQRKGISI
jgi:hypothetical protein